MSLNSKRTLGFVVKLVDRASRPADKIRRSFNKMDKQAGQSAKKFDMAKSSAGALRAGLGLLAGGVVALGAAFSAAISAGEFEQDLNRTRLIMGATATEMDALREKAIESGLKTQFSPQEALQGLKDLGTLGFNAAEGIKALDGTLDFAAAAGLEMGQAATVTGAALRIFSKDADFATEAADKLLKISTLTALQAPDLEVALGNVARGAGLAKQGMDEMLISVGLIKNTGVQASKAGSQVSIALLKMAQNAGSLKKLGVEVTNADGSFRDFLDVVLDVDKATAGITDQAERTEVIRKNFGRGVGAISAIMTQLKTGVKDANGHLRTGAAAVEVLRGRMQNAAGTSKKFRDAVLNTLPGQITLIKGMWETLKLEIGTGLAKILKPIVVTAKEMFERLIKGFKALNPTVRDFMGKAVLLGGVVAVLGGGILVLVGGVMALIPIFMAAASAIAAAAPWIVGFGAAIGAVILLFKAFKSAYDQNVGGFANTVGSVIEKVTLLFSGLFQLISEGVITGDTAKKLRNAENAGVLHFLVLAFKWGHRVSVFFDEFSHQLDSFVRGMGTSFEELGKALDKVWNVLGDIVGMFDRLTPTMGETEGAAKTLANLLGTVVNILVNIGTAALSFWSGVFEAMEPILRPIIDKVMKSFIGVKDAVVDLLTELGILGDGAAANSDVFEGLGNALGIVIDIALIPMLGMFEAVMAGIRIMTRAVTGVVRVFKETFGAIGNIVDGVIKLFNGDLTGAMEDFGTAWDRIWESIADIFRDIFTEISGIFDEMLDFIAETIQAIPDQFRPDALGEWAEGRLSISQADMDAFNENIAAGEADVDAQRAMDDSFSRMALDNPIVPFANSTGNAEKKGGGEKPLTADDFERLMAEADEQVNGPKEIRAVIKIGNDKLGEAVASLKKNSIVEAFMGGSPSEDG